MNAKIDGNRKATLIGVSSVDAVTPTNIAVNPSNGAMLIDGTSLYATLDSRYLELSASLADVTNRSHTVLTDIGTNTHAHIDTHLAATSDPHGSTLTQT